MAEMELTHVRTCSKIFYYLALRLLFRTEYGDPGQKGANPPTVGSEQGYYKVSNVQIQSMKWIPRSKTCDIVNCLQEWDGGERRWGGAARHLHRGQWVILLHILSVCFALVSRRFEVHSKDTSSTFSKCFSRDCFKTRFSLLFLAIFLQLVQS